MQKVNTQSLMVRESPSKVSIYTKLVFNTTWLMKFLRICLEEQVLKKY